MRYREILGFHVSLVVHLSDLNVQTLVDTSQVLDLGLGILELGVDPNAVGVHAGLGHGIKLILVGNVLLVKVVVANQQLLNFSVHHLQSCLILSKHVVLIA